MLERAWLTGFSTKSDFARTNADYVAIAMSQFYITTLRLDGEYGHTWQITPTGLKELWKRRRG